MNLKKEIDSYWNKVTGFQPPFAVLELKKKDLAEVAKHFVEWQKQKDKQTIKLAENHTMLAGMMKERERMLKNAIEGVARPDDCEIWVNLKGCNCNYKDGDKIKLIIIKEEEK